MNPRTQPSETGAEDEPHADRIAWRQILVGYGLVLIMLLVVGSSLFPDIEGMKGVLTAVVVGATLAATLLERPASAFHRAVLSESPGLDDALQWAAIVALLLLSAGTIVFGVLTLPASG